MKLIHVVFGGNNSKEYVFLSKLNFIRGAIYEIVADNITTYNNYVQVVKIEDCSKKPKGIALREITSYTLIYAPPKPDGGVSKVISNPDKGTTVVLWKDGTKTIVKCQEGEEFDAEKGVALCFMKRAFNNRGCYNDVFKNMEVV